MKIDKIETGDISLDKWIEYFNLPIEKKTNTKFIRLMTDNKIDKYFLTVSPPQNIEDIDFPDDGLLEKDFRIIAFEEESQNIAEKTRIILAIALGANLKPWLVKYKELFFEVIEKCFIEGDYEKYDIEFEKVLKIAVEKNYIEQNEFAGVALLRGMCLGSRYDSEKKEKKLKREIKTNHIKKILGL